MMQKKAKKAQPTPEATDLPRAMARLGMNLRQRRKQLSISFDKAAQITGLSPRTIRRMEAGDTGVSLRVLATYLNILGLGSHFLNFLMAVFTELRENEDKAAFGRAVDELRNKMLSEKL